MTTKLTLSKSERRRLFVVVGPIGCGKTTVVRNLKNYRNADHTEILFIDIDEFSLSIEGITEIVQDEATKDLNLFPRLRDRVFQLVKDNPDARLVIVTSNYKFAKFIEVKPKRTSVFCPSLHLFTATAKTLDEDETVKHQASREDILKTFSPILKYYNTFEELEGLFVKIYDLIRQS